MIKANGSRAWRLLLWAVCTAWPCGAATVWLAVPGAARAQQAEVLPDEEEGAGEVADDAPAAEGDVPPDTGETILSWAFRSLGKGYSIVFLSLSFTLVALFVMNLITARRENVMPAQLITDFETCLNERKYQEAYDRAKSDDSFLGRILSAGLFKISTAGYNPAIEAMQEVGEDENMKMEHRLSYMALIGTISPMIGLLGTVHGMISSFQVIATSTTAPKPSKLAEGISTALFTTLVGLFIAIPAIAAYNILRNRVARLVLEVGIVSEGLMSRLQAAGARRQPAASPQAGGAASPDAAQARPAPAESAGVEPPEPPGKG